MTQNFNQIDWMKYFDAGKWLKEAKLPTFDIDGLMAAQQKNIDALTQANKVAIEGLQALTRRQAEIMSETVAHMTDGVKNAMSAKSPEDGAVKQAEIAKKTVEQTFSHAREMAELVTKSAEAAFNPLHRRWLAGFDEMKTAFVPPVNVVKAKAAAE